MNEDSRDGRGRAKAFRHLWGPIFEQVDSIDSLNRVLGNCCVDWLAKTVDRNDQPVAQRTGGMRIRVGLVGVRIDILGGVIRQARFDSDKAARIQKLFRIYPGRAMREVFEEKSDSFSGSLESAKDFLSTTYMGEELSLGQVLEARAILDECLWREPGQDHLSLLGNPPTHQEIATKLKKMRKTRPQG